MPSKAAKTLADFRAAHDLNVIIPNKIRAALGAMYAEGAENWEYEQDFMRRAGLSQTQIGAFREQFADHIVTTPHANGRQPKRVWFADRKAAKAARGG